MSQKKTIIIYDALTGETIQQELTQEEIAEREEQHLASEAEKQARLDAKNSALAKLAALGLTEAEIAAL